MTWITTESQIKMTPIQWSQPQHWTPGIAKPSRIQIQSIRTHDVLQKGNRTLVTMTGMAMASQIGKT
ncbi:MAG: hypothetical protein CL968_02395 [Euryarchaeota archaeon]|nr:hypothetical protein [Euryarchaeota archaeon]